MRQPRRYQEYGKDSCCPSEWDHTPNMTGNFEFDGSIQRCRNGDMHGKLEDHIADGHMMGMYGHRTAYGRGLD